MRTKCRLYMHEPRMGMTKGFDRDRYTLVANEVFVS